MTYVKQIDINNYRGIIKLQYKPKKINLIIGRNNSGKTSVIQAIYSSITGKIRYENIIDGNIIKYNVNVHAKYSEITTDTHHLIFYNDIRNISSEYNKVVENLINERLLGALKTSNKYNKISEKSSIYGQFKEYLIENHLIMATIYDDNVKIIINPSIRSFQNFDVLINNIHNILDNADDITDDDTQMEIINLLYSLFPNRNRESDSDNNDVLFIGNTNKWYPTLFNKSENLLKLNQLVKNNNLLPHCETLMVEQGVHYKEGDFEYYLPYETHGTGFMVLLDMIYNIGLLNNAVILIEEPENHLHPGYVKTFINQLLSLSEKQNIQIFMTSHSYDVIEELAYSAMDSSMKDDVVISRIRKIGMEHIMDNFTPEYALKTINELKIDLRGS